MTCRGFQKSIFGIEFSESIFDLWGTERRNCSDFFVKERGSFGTRPLVPLLVGTVSPSVTGTINRMEMGQFHNLNL